MISICESYAKDYSILFNPKKSKLLCFNSSTVMKPQVYLCEQLVDVVESEIYLGSRIYNNIYTKNVDEIVSDLYRRSNQIRSSFRMCDSFTLNDLHSTYCTSFYGVELYNFNELYINKIYTAWRKCTRLIFRLPNRAHNCIVSNIDYCIITRLDLRLAKYIHNLIHNSNAVVRSIVTSKLLFHSKSIFSENYKYLSFKYKLGHLDWSLNISHVLKHIKIVEVLPQQRICDTVIELCKLRDGLIECEFVNNVAHIQSMIDSLCIA